MKTAVACLGCIVLALFVMYICTKMMKLNRTVVEGLISRKKETLTPDELLKQAEAFRNEMSDNLNIKKYGATYKKLLTPKREASLVASEQRPSRPFNH